MAALESGREHENNINTLVADKKVGDLHLSSIHSNKDTSNFTQNPTTIMSLYKEPIAKLPLAARKNGELGTQLYLGSSKD